MKTRVILIGGFLGAGKTTLLKEVARKLTERGVRVGLITNDQAAELVDTVFLERYNDNVSEVSGSCFCCNYEGFTGALKYAAKSKQAQIVIAEPVGSCTDLSATILQPLKHQFAAMLEVAPLTVLVDPDRLEGILSGGSAGLHDSAAYILRKQLEEADVIVISKSDLLTSETIGDLTQRASLEWPFAKIFAISAPSGEGVDSWLDEVLSSQTAGTRIAQVDYDKYAEGEAVLGWLNARFALKSRAADWDNLAKALLQALSARFEALNVAVGHVKLLIDSEEHFVIGNLTGKSETISIRETAGVSAAAEMTINARVQMPPDDLKKIVLEEVSAICGPGIQSELLAIKSLSPGRPNPTFRFDHVV